MQKIDTKKKIKKKTWKNKVHALKFDMFWITSMVLGVFPSLRGASNVWFGNSAKVACPWLRMNLSAWW